MSGQPWKRAPRALHRDFLQAHVDHEARALVLSNIGACLSALGRQQEAEDHHRQAILADPEHLGPRWNLFANLHGQGRSTDALAVLDHALELTSLEQVDGGNIHAYRSELLLQLGRRCEALAAIDASLVSAPDSPDRLFTRGKILVELGWLVQGRVVLLRVLELAPGFEAARRLLLRISEARGVERN